MSEYHYLENRIYSIIEDDSLEEKPFVRLLFHRQTLLLSVIGLLDVREIRYCLCFDQNIKYPDFIEMCTFSPAKINYKDIWEIAESAIRKLDGIISYIEERMEIYRDLELNS